MYVNTSTTSRAVIANYGISKDARAHIREQPCGLLQQPALRRRSAKRCHWLQRFGLMNIFEHV